MLKRMAASLLTIILAAGMMVMVMAQTESTTDTYIDKFPVTNATPFTVYPYARDKSNSSSMYLYITSLTVGTYVRVQARGMEYPDWTYYNATASNTSNETCLADGTSVYYVTCSVGVDYSVHSLINEHGFEAATFGFQTPYASTTTKLSGYWSSDSAYSHTDAY